MNREYYKRYSPALKREMEILIFGDKGTPVLFFPARMGRFYDYENWRIMEAIQDKVEQGHIQVFCVDSIDIETFYCDNCSSEEKINRYLRYEQYILKEVIPLMQSRKPGFPLISAGCSLGGFHAVNFAFKHPHLFCKVLGISGRYDLSQQISHYSNLLPDYWGESVYYNMPNQYIPNLTNVCLLQALQNLEITLVVGQDDPFWGSNNFLSQALHTQGIYNDFHVWHGEAHRPYYWRQMVRLYL